LIKRSVNFIDVTGHDYPNLLSEESGNTTGYTFPTMVSQNTTVLPLLGKINATRMEEFVEYFSSFHSRVYASITSQKWLLNEIETSIAEAKKNGYLGNATVVPFSHSSFPQKSIIARIIGTDPTLRQEIVIIGAHQDSINKWGPWMPAPGADDNASGSVVVLETLRVLIFAGYLPRRTIEFHWYAAEEIGLRGSGEIAKSYYKSGAKVVSMINFDVTGHQPEDVKEIGIYTDNANPQLVQFLRVLVDTYLTFGRRDCKCGYGCSDHASWTKYGFAAAMPAEAVFNLDMHSTSDSLSRVGMTQIVEFTKLSIGYAVEISEPDNNNITSVTTTTEVPV